MKIKKTLLFLSLLMIITFIMLGCSLSSNSNSFSNFPLSGVPVINSTMVDWNQAIISWNTVDGARGYLIWITPYGPGSNSYYCINQKLNLNIGKITLSNLPSINDLVNKGLIMPITDTTYSIPMDLYFPNEGKFNYGQVIYAEVLALGDNASMNRMSPPAKITFKNDGHIGTWSYISNNETITYKYVYTLNADGTYTYYIYMWNVASMNWDTIPTAGDSGRYRIEYNGYSSNLIYFTKFKTISAGVEFDVTGNIREDSPCDFQIISRDNAPYAISISYMNYYYNF